MKNIILILIGFVLLSFYSCSEEHYTYKTYLIDHFDEMKGDSVKPKLITIDVYDEDYYTDVSIQRLDSMTYMVVFWGDRSSWLWYIYKDYDFHIYGDYDPSELDLELIETFKGI